MTTTLILQHIRKHGQIYDVQIADALGIGLVAVRSSIQELVAKEQISCCTVTRFSNGVPSEGILCRIAGYIPPRAPGRKPKS